MTNDSNGDETQENRDPGVGTNPSDAIPSGGGDEHPTGNDSASSEDNDRHESRELDDDDAVVEPEIVQPGTPETRDAGSSLAERWPRDTFGDDERGEPGPGQISLFQATAGPLPEVDQLAGYGRLDPSFPERIMRMAEASTTDVSARDDRALNAEIGERRRGQTAAIVLAFSGLIASVVFASLGHYWIAAALISVPFVLLVRALLGDVGRRRPGGQGESPAPPNDDEDD